MSKHTQGASAPVEFNYTSNKIRVVTDEHGNPWFCAKDVCDTLGYTNSRKAIADHCKQKGVTNRYTLTEGGLQELQFLDEGNMYRLIIKSNKPESDPFEAWVCDEVLPAIRKQGYYGQQKLKYADWNSNNKRITELTQQLSATKNALVSKRLQEEISERRMLAGLTQEDFTLISKDIQQSSLPGFDDDGLGGAQ